VGGGELLGPWFPTLCVHSSLTLLFSLLRFGPDLLAGWYFLLSCLAFVVRSSTVFPGGKIGFVFWFVVCFFFFFFCCCGSSHFFVSCVFGVCPVLVLIWYWRSVGPAWEGPSEYGCMYALGRGQAATLGGGTCFAWILWVPVAGVSSAGWGGGGFCVVSPGVSVMYLL